MEPTDNTNTAPAIREEVVSMLTPHEVSEYLRRIEKIYKPLFQDVGGFSVSIQTCLTSPCYLSAWTLRSPNDWDEHISASGETFDEAAIDLRRKVGDNSERITQKRKQAARLLAEADALEGKTSAAA